MKAPIAEVWAQPGAGAQAAGAQAGAQSGAEARSERLMAAAIAALLGLGVIWGVGFSHVPAWHNAAHDSRHSLAFPCH